jgi:hypothetical protein
VFPVDREFSLDDAVLSFGGALRRQAVLPFASPDDAVTLEPATVPMKSKVVAGNAVFNFEGAFLTADAYWNHSSLAQDEVALRLDYSLTNQTAESASLIVVRDDFSLELPDGTSVEATTAPIGEVSTSGATQSDRWVRFIIPAPIAGKYKLLLRGKWGGAYNLADAEAEYPFQLDNVPSFGPQ